MEKGMLVPSCWLWRGRYLLVVLTSKGVPWRPEQAPCLWPGSTCPPARSNVDVVETGDPRMYLEQACEVRSHPI